MLPYANITTILLYDRSRYHFARGRNTFSESLVALCMAMRVFLLHNNFICDQVSCHSSFLLGWLYARLYTCLMAAMASGERRRYWANNCIMRASVSSHTSVTKPNCWALLAAIRSAAMLRVNALSLLTKPGNNKLAPMSGHNPHLLPMMASWAVLAAMRISALGQYGSHRQRQFPLILAITGMGSVCQPKTTRCTKLALPGSHLNNSFTILLGRFIHFLHLTQHKSDHHCLVVPPQLRCSRAAVVLWCYPAL